MKKVNSITLTVFLSLAIMAGISCIEQKPYNSPPGYDLNNPIKYFMPESLTEISGIAFHHGKNDTIYAEQDEAGKVYYFKQGDKQVTNVKFGKPGDFEDIAILGEQVIMLRSDGVLFVFPFKEMRGGNVQNILKFNEILPQGEYEGLYADEQAGQVYVMCKHCSMDNTAKTNTIFAFNLSPNGTIKQAAQYSLNVRDIEAQLGQKRIAFHPSAIAKNKNTNEWYIVSSVNKIIVVTDANFKVKMVYPINPSLFIQPEGIAFDSQNNLYISNEGDKITPGTVYRFNYKK
ncbi:SdiA-regulated family protein [Mucilaginibacter corticis]|uniref:SdiA-regulated family protein n=1 Tax=Mucilaginibacter corticis TaxID=2597670 RepID=A0A556MW04_9SPHI|nr:SdiA-regulated domain-containing protein [Mucilaginibacter corticis]TSJ43979.1 SdiA-regulated family protein [Mucilaginibacter corticis]